EDAEQAEDVRIAALRVVHHEARVRRVLEAVRVKVEAWAGHGFLGLDERTSALLAAGGGLSHATFDACDDVFEHRAHIDLVGVADVIEPTRSVEVEGGEEEPHRLLLRRAVW